MRLIPGDTMSAETHRVLLLGAGLVARPIVRYLLDQPGYIVTVASRTVRKADALIEGHPRGRAVALDVSDEAALEALVADHDLSVSLLPAPRHPDVARLCLKHGKHMATTSYISPAMRAMDADVKARGLLFINECGVDPGIDHMTAMKIFHDAWKRGGKVVTFKSYCGGLPAPEANTNPLGYKFSWAPRGVLVAATNSAIYLKDGKEVRVDGKDLLSHNHLLEVPDAGTFEAYPNRDSLSYIDTYGLQGVSTMFRGTLRNLGHCARWTAWSNLGLFRQDPVVLADRTLAGLLRALLGVSRGVDLPAALAAKMGVSVDADPVVNLGWLGFFEETPIPAGLDAPVDVTAAVMTDRMPYAEGERDMLVMRHEVISEFADHRELTTMNFVDFGIPGGDTSMARTVSLPVAIAIRLFFDGMIQARGVWGPILPEFYVPILAELETMNIVCHEQTVRL